MTDTNNSTYYVIYNERLPHKLTACIKRAGKDDEKFGYRDKRSWWPLNKIGVGPEPFADAPIHVRTRDLYVIRKSRKYSTSPPAGRRWFNLVVWPTCRLVMVDQRTYPS